MANPENSSSRRHPGEDVNLTEERIVLIEDAALLLEEAAVGLETGGQDCGCCGRFKLHNFGDKQLHDRLVDYAGALHRIADGGRARLAKRAPIKPLRKAGA